VAGNNVAWRVVDVDVPAVGVTSSRISSDHLALQLDFLTRPRQHVAEHRDRHFQPPGCPARIVAVSRW